MKIVLVTDKGTEKEFIKFPHRLYKGDSNYVAPFDTDVKKAFNPQSNVHFKQGDAIRWLLKDDSGKTIGRIAAFYEKNKAEADYVNSGACGFFDCINHQEAANLLFDTAAKWLKERGFEAMIGPVNFGENESNWGCLVHGFMQQGYGMAYNKSFYQNLMESYGFKLYYRQLSYHIDLNKPFPERFWKIAEWVNNKPNYSFRHFSYKEADKFINDTVSIYNQAWPKLKDDFIPMEFDVLKEMMDKAKPILNPELVWFAYNNDEPIAFFTFLPDANQIFKHLNGKLHLLNKLKFIWLKSRKPLTRMRGIAGGVVPKFQNSGIESAIIWQMKQVVEKNPQFKEIEISWVGDYNPKMIAIYQATGAAHAKTHHTYMYMIDKGIPFKRYMGEAAEDLVKKTVSFDISLNATNL